MANNYQVVTDRIVAMLEQGVRPWAKSWKAGEVSFTGLVRPLSGATGKPYTGINTLNLAVAAQLRGFASRYWFTYPSAQQAGGQVRRGAKSELAFYVGQTTKTEQADDGTESERSITFLKTFHVFNADEIDGLPAHYYGAQAVPAPVVDGRIASVDAFIAATGATIAHGGDRAFYMPSADAIRLPHMAAFESPEAYYSTALHELGHWTGVESRCNRTMGKRFGDDAYAAEELVAELSAAFACADLGVSAEPRDDHASYLAGWLKVLKADNRAIFTAAALAERAVTFLHSLQPAEAPEAIELALAA